MCRVMNDSAESPSGPGAALRRVRMQAEVSAAELARLAGVAQNTILNAERGATPSPANRRRIVAALATLLDKDEAATAVAVARAEVERARAALHRAESWHERVCGADDPETIWNGEPVA